MQINNWLAQTSQVISRLDAELILLSVLRSGGTGDVGGVGNIGGAGGASDALGRTYLVAHGEDELTEEQVAQANSLVRRRCEGVPVAYLTGKREFYGREFLVDENVLVPRPETEEIIEIAKELVRALRVKDGSTLHVDGDSALKTNDEDVLRTDDSLLRIWDVGTGSGCVAISLALEIEKSEVLATDISAGALEVAQKNAKLLGAENVSFLQSDLLENVSEDLPDILVANLPYVDRNWDFLSRELEFEPEEALFAGEGGLAEIRRLLEQVNDRWGAKKHIIYILLESDTSQQNTLAEMAERMGFSIEKVLGFITVLKKGFEKR